MKGRIAGSIGVACVYYSGALHRDDYGWRSFLVATMFFVGCFLLRGVGAWSKRLRDPLPTADEILKEKDE